VKFESNREQFVQQGEITSVLCCNEPADQCLLRLSWVAPPQVSIVRLNAGPTGSQDKTSSPPLARPICVHFLFNFAVFTGGVRPTAGVGGRDRAKMGDRSYPAGTKPTVRYMGSHSVFGFAVLTRSTSCTGYRGLPNGVLHPAGRQQPEHPQSRDDPAAPRPQHPGRGHASCA
jgi:hypothetical protein